MKRLFKKIISFLFKTSDKNKFKKFSYSQSGEDLIIKFIFDNLNIQNPSYLDIGAHHPYYLSNTALFYQNGSRGINIEPDPELFKNFITNRDEDLNLNVGVGDINGVLDFYIISSPTLNTFSKTEAEKYSKEGNYKIKEVKKIEVLTLSEILDIIKLDKFPEFLSVDAEGVDEIVIKQIDFEKNFPLVICLETISFSTTGNGVKNIELINYIVDKGYLLYADTNINTIFVKKEIWER
ncbi:FkbM family methyltransferase [Flavobacterium nitrogenifigens]|uniref:FkbM family methyltransferase n=2 Tax=Flavobacterium TaxID=237 RepID=A0A7W7N9N5_9FLAO|nr:MULTISPECIES: FkbM family methyltransferase [Flavobacterium]MBB4803659.1 FkbM family methyltransferase [Flavobacterium nitrogenifigens]MBB6388536.1 FkbM family methyltransferase [Flavobacterium notoginsengisoli]